jgi:hypothetical protein
MPLPACTADAAELLNYLHDLKLLDEGTLADMFEAMAEYGAVQAALEESFLDVEELQETDAYMYFYWDDKFPEGIALFRWAVVLPDSGSMQQAGVPQHGAQGG